MLHRGSRCIPRGVYAFLHAPHCVRNPSYAPRCFARRGGGPQTFDTGRPDPHRVRGRTRGSLQIAPPLGAVATSNRSTARRASSANDRPLPKSRSFLARVLVRSARGGLFAPLRSASDGIRGRTFASQAAGEPRIGRAVVLDSIKAALNPHHGTGTDLVRVTGRDWCGVFIQVRPLTAPLRRARLVRGLCAPAPVAPRRSGVGRRSPSRCLAQLVRRSCLSRFRTCPCSFAVRSSPRRRLP